MIFLLIGVPFMVGSLALIWKIRKSSQMTDMLKTLKKIEENTNPNPDPAHDKLNN